MGLLDDGEVPEVVKDLHAKYWWALLVVLIAVCGLEIASVDIFGAIFTGIVAFIVYYMVSNRCQQMTQYCLVMFALLCFIEAVFETISLLMMVGGRTEQHNETTSQPGSQDSGVSSVTYVTVVQWHPFFDKTQGFIYNLQSALKIAGPVVMALGVFLAYRSYSAFPTGLLSDPGPEAGGGGRFQYGA